MESNEYKQAAMDRAGELPVERRCFPAMTLRMDHIGGVGHGNLDGVPAVIFGRSAESDVLTASAIGCMGAITFDSVELLDMVAEQLAELRTKAWPSAPAVPVAAELPAAAPTAMWAYAVSPPQGFTDYVAKNYNGDVNFHDPAWHALRLWNAAMRNAQPPAVNLEALRNVRRMLDGSQPKDIPGAIMAIDAMLAAAPVLSVGLPSQPIAEPDTATQAAKPLTNDRILELAEPFGAFEFGDAQGHKRIAFARAIESHLKGG